MPDNEGSSVRDDAAHTERSGRAGAIGIVALVGAVPLVLLLVGYLVLSVAGVSTSKAMSLSGLVTVGAAGAWGLAVGIFRLDEKLFGRKQAE